jgi:hypothetical protein
MVSDPIFLIAPRAGLPSTAASEEPEHDQKQDSADRRRDDGVYNADAKVDAQLGQQPTADQGADNSDTHIGNETKSRATNDFAGKPTRDQADKQDDEDAFTRHGNPSLTLSGFALSASMRVNDAEDNLPLSHMPSGETADLVNGDMIPIPRPITSDDDLAQLLQ